MWFNWATGEAMPDAPDFLSWVPGSEAEEQYGPPLPPGMELPPDTPAKPEAPELAKVGERWQIVFDVNRRLGYFEMSAAKNAFGKYMPDQRLDTVVQSDSPPPKVVLTTTYIQNALRPIPIGQVIDQSGIVATLVSAKRIQ
jgi:hypothetical protein